MVNKMKTVPKEWKKVKIKNVCRVVSGSTPRTDNNLFWNGKINWLTPLDLSKNKSVYIGSSIRTITEEGLNSCSAELVPENSLIMSSRAPIGYLAINKIPSATNQGCKSFICSDKILTEYFYYCLLKNIDQVKRLGSGSTFTEVGKKSLDELFVVLPPLAEQRRIADILSEVDNKIDNNKQIKTKLTELKKGLMQDLLSGRVRV